MVSGGATPSAFSTSVTFVQFQVAQSQSTSIETSGTHLEDCPVEIGQSGPVPQDFENNTV
jgi:hypothetical protein